MGKHLFACLFLASVFWNTLFSVQMVSAERNSAPASLAGEMWLGRRVVERGLSPGAEPTLLGAGSSRLVHSLPPVGETSWLTALATLGMAACFLAVHTPRAKTIRVRSRPVQAEIDRRRRVESELRENEAHLRSLLEAAQDFVVYRMAVDRNEPTGARVVLVSPSIKELIGIDDPYRFEGWFENIHPEDLPRIVEANERSWKYGEPYNQAVRVFNPHKGEWVWVHTISTPVFDEQGQLAYFNGLVTDITRLKRAESILQSAQAELENRIAERTAALAHANESLRIEIAERQRVEEALRVSQALYSEIFDNTPHQMFLIDVLPGNRFRIVTTNPAHQEKSGLRPEDIHGKSLDEVIPPEFAKTICQHYLDCIAAGEPVSYEESGPSPFWDTQNIRIYRTTVGPVRDSHGKINRLVGISTDITEQKQAEAALAQKDQEAAVTAERSRLARELHDAVTQTLFSASLVAEVLPRLWERSPEEGRKRLQELRELTRGALAEMRTLLLELRPSALVESDLPELFRPLVDAFTGRTRIPARLIVEGAPWPVRTDQKLVCYRVAQEALNNTAKHADAGCVEVSLSYQEGGLELCIRDDGRGFDPKGIPGDHMGIGIMRERAQGVGASLMIESEIGKGTRIQLKVENPCQTNP